MAPLKNMGPDMGPQYYAVESEIERLEGLCMSQNTWGLVNRGKRLGTIEAKKLCEEETRMRWRFYYWAECWNHHQTDGQLERCGDRPALPGEPEVAP